MRQKFAALFAVLLFGFCFYSLFASKTPAFGAYAEHFEIYTSAGSFGNNAAYTDKKGYGTFGYVAGESCYVTVPYEQVLEDFSATHLFSEKTENGENFYAYSSKLPRKIYIKGKAVNIHYFAGENANKLGTPIIYGGY